MTIRRNTALFASLLIAITIMPLPGLAQGAFPRDGNESLALRLYNRYRVSQANLARLQTDRSKTRRDIEEVAPGGTLVPNAILVEDAIRLQQIEADITAEQNRLRQLEEFWDKNRAVPPAPTLTFAGRYGPLSNNGNRSTDPRYDQIEYAIRNFPFNGTTSSPTATTARTVDFNGTWSGTYNNSRNEPGSQETTLVETNGKVEGTDGGLKILDGRRTGNTMTWRLETGGGAAKGGVTWNMTVQIMDNGNTLVERYTGRDHRTDKNDGGSYTGVATLHRK